MARLTFLPVRLAGRVSGWNHRPEFIIPEPSAKTLSENGADLTRHYGGVTIPDVRVHMLTVLYAPIGFFSDGEPYTHPMYAIVVDPDQAELIRPVLPMGYVIEPFWNKRNEERYAVRVDELHLLNEWYRRHLDMVAQADRGSLPSWECNHVWRHMDIDTFAQRDDKVRQLASVTQSHKLMPITFDMNNEADLNCTIRSSAGVSAFGQGSVTSIGIRDSRYPHLPARMIDDESRSLGVREIIQTWQASNSGTIPVKGFTALGLNHAAPAMLRARKALAVDRPSVDPAPPASGRRIVLDDEVPKFPAATRCILSNSGQAMLAFGINADQGSYHQINATDNSNTAAWGFRDFMLIHRDVDCWRFIFWCYFDLHYNVLKDTRGVMLMPYVVYDHECARRPLTVNPQRRMPLATTRAIYETPYCAAAISHGLSRLRYARSQIKVFNEPMGKEADLHHPRFGALFRTSPHHGSLYHETYSGASKKAKAEGTHRAGKALNLLTEGLRPTRTEWEDQADAPLTSVLGAAVHKPRSVMLDM